MGVDVLVAENKLMNMLVEYTHYAERPQLSEDDWHQIFQSCREYFNKIVTSELASKTRRKANKRKKQKRAYCK